MSIGAVPAGATFSEVGHRGVGRAAARLGAAGGLALVAAAWGVLAGRAPVLALAAGLAAGLVSLAFRRLDVALGMLVSSFFFDAYVNRGSQGVNAVHALGAIVAAAWGMDWLLGRRRAVWDPALPILAAFLVVVLASTLTAQDAGAAMTVAVRYISFAALFFFVIQFVDGSPRRAGILAGVALAAASLAALVGLVRFLTGATARANGPLPDPNDYAVLLAVLLPLALARLELAQTRRARFLAVIAGALLSAAILASFSRSALMGLAVAGAWALLTGRLRLRLVLPVLAIVALAVGVAVRVEHRRVEHAVLVKSHVAEQNVQARFSTWTFALKEFAASPVLGVGPGNSAQRSTDFDTPEHLAAGSWVTHNVYLNVLAELGLPGAVLYLAFLMVSWARLRQRLPDPADDRFQSALAAGFLVAVVAGIFLNEQFFPQLWLLPALGATLVPCDR